MLKSQNSSVVTYTSGLLMFPFLAVLFPQNLAEPQGTKQPYPRKAWSETRDDAKSEGNVAEKGAV